ncbi:MAG: thermonuclease family protein [Candidatus Sumerlaeia bacterium]|nr:thermonuclease family protein [Candidatus Sumerlaeia bacterium]
MPPRRKAASRAKPSARRRGGRGGGSWKVRALGLLGSLLLFLAAGAYHYLGGDTAPRPGIESQPDGTGSAAVALTPTATEYVVAYVERVVDGDTLLVTAGGREERVRLLCVDTEESVHPDASKNTEFGRDAARYTRSRLEGRQVRLLADAEGDARDRYQRLLAYVLVDGENFNIELVRRGYSRYETKWGRSGSHDAEFRAAEAAARRERLGLWR